MSKKVKALLLDSKEGKVKEITFDGNYNSVHELLGDHVSQIEWRNLSSNIIYYDMEQEENYTKKDRGFQFDNGFCKYGNALIVGNSVDENSHINWVGTDVTLKKELVEKETTFGVLGKVLCVVE